MNARVNPDDCLSEAYIRHEKAYLELVKANMLDAANELLAKASRSIAYNSNRQNYREDCVLCREASTDSIAGVEDCASGILAYAHIESIADSVVDFPVYQTKVFQSLVATLKHYREDILAITCCKGNRTKQLRYERKARLAKRLRSLSPIAQWYAVEDTLPKWIHPKHSSFASMPDAVYPSILASKVEYVVDRQGVVIRAYKGITHIAN